MTETNHSDKNVTPSGESKVRVTFSNIKAAELITSDHPDKHEAYIKFEVDAQNVKETQVAADHTNLAWPEAVVIETTLDRDVQISARISDSKSKNVESDNTVGVFSLSLKDLANGKSTQTWKLEHEEHAGKNAGHVTADVLLEHVHSQESKSVENPPKITQQQQQQQQQSEKHDHQASLNTQPADNSSYKHNLSQSINESGSQSTRKFDEYSVAKKNLRNGFGMSEYQSANSLQNSVVATTFPKEKRFHHKEQLSGPQYIALPSIFSNSKKGANFGQGARGFMITSKNPGPGAYEVSSKLFQKNPTTFGESRSRCKNSIALQKTSSQEPIQTQPRLQNSKTEFRLPQINQSASAIFVKPERNYHYLHQQNVS